MLYTNSSDFLRSSSSATVRSFIICSRSFVQRSSVFIIASKMLKFLHATHKQTNGCTARCSRYDMRPSWIITDQRLSQNRSISAVEMYLTMRRMGRVLTSQICKVMESVARDAVVHHLDKYNLIQNSQHGFRKGFSCTTNLLTFLEEITANIDAKHSVDTGYCIF